MGTFPRYWPFVRGIHRSTVNSPHKGQWRRALMFPLICDWINGWVNNREAGDLRRYCVHCDAIVMIHKIFSNRLGTPEIFHLYFPVGGHLWLCPLIWLNTLKPRQNGHDFADDIFKCIFLNENVLILMKCSLMFVPKGPINNIPALVQQMAWRHPGDKPLF